MYNDLDNPSNNEKTNVDGESNTKNIQSSSIRSVLDSAKSNIQDIMKTFGGLNNSEINNEFKKIDKQLDRRDIYIKAFQRSSKKPEYNNIEFLLNGENVGKLINASASQGGEGSMDYIFNFKFEKGESNENPYVRSKDIIIPII